MANGGRVGRFDHTVTRLQRLDDRLRLSPEPRWEREGSPRSSRGWLLRHPTAYAVLVVVLGVAAVASGADVLLVATIGVALVLVHLGLRRRRRAWERSRQGQREGRGSTS
jgi:Flp pilus assembly protein TadB